MPDKRPLNILLAASEALPFAKTGGLGDVLGALPLHLSRLGARVRVAIPFYRKVALTKHLKYRIISALEVRLGNNKYITSIYRSSVNEDYEVFLVRHDPSFDRPQIYGENGQDYADNARRFALFSRAVASLMERLDDPPDIVHCHDWQTALIPLFLEGKKPSVFTIHNIGYQGLFSPEILPEIGVSGDLFTPEGLEFWGQVNFLKAGIIWGDAVTTVSPQYAREIRQPEHGFGLDGLLRKHSGKLSGILNGVDYEAWNPAGDPLIAARYHTGNLAGKAACRRDLLESLGLALPGDVPLIGMTTRLALQKGIDILQVALPDLLALDLGLVILGSGDPAFEEALTSAAAVHPNLKVVIGFDERLAHRIMAGSDMFLMPSRYEPCGLSQMYALKYGTVPVARATGGIIDTVKPFEAGTGHGTGFTFDEETPAALLEGVRRALRAWRQPKAWRRLMENGMIEDHSWSRAAEEYLALYRDMIDMRKGAR